MIKSITWLVLGVCIGYGATKFFQGDRAKHYVRLDAVTLSRSELDHLARAIELIKDKEPSREYWRYEADSHSHAG